MAENHSIAGTKFGKLTAVELASGSAKHPKWLFSCDCGRTKIIQLGNVKSGHTKSCGCIRNRNAGIAKHPLGNTYTNMLYRCYSRKCKEYRWYGARGIKVCDRWLESFHNFVADMGDRPDDRSIDRIDNDGDYTPENCRWATRIEQGSNTRTTLLYTHDGETHSASQWSRNLGGHPLLVQSRINKLGWSIEDAITKPLRNTKAHR